jgi:REP element-mobilizing transposase RayT
LKKGRRSIRLHDYDYSQPGAYFVTICALDRECLFGDVRCGKMALNELGKIVAESWQWLERQYEYVVLDEWVVMPNHLHGIVVITDCRGGSRTCGMGRGDLHTGGTGRGGSRTAPTGSDQPKRKPLGRLIGAFKTVSTKQVNEIHNTPGAKLWQRNYYEHIIRNENELNRIRAYIAQNPAKWEFDRENPSGRS